MSKEALQDVQSVPREDLPGSAPVVQPGRMLRVTRERQGLTPQDIAARLNLDVRVIQALEDDRYDDLRVPAYVRGYLRSYGRLLGVNPEELIRAYDRVAEQAPPLHPFKSRPAAQADTSHNLVQGMTVLVVVAVLALTITWWWTREQPNPLPTADPLGAETPAATEPAAAVAGTVTLGDGQEYRYPVVDHNATLSAAAPAALAGPSEEDFTPPDEQAEETAAATAASEATDPTAAGSPDPVADAAAPAETVAPAGDGLRSLNLSLRGKAWIEIYDADGKRLFFNMGAPGQTISTRGKPPLKLTIGNINMAELAVDGVAVDLAALAVEGVARVQVNSDSIERAQRRLED